MTPKFSEAGSNAIAYEKEVYQLFVRYVREVASGRRSCGDSTLQLRHILEFVTGASEEPVLGFVMPPSLEFGFPTEVTVLANTEGTSSVTMGGFTPTAHTCGNVLHLPRPTHETPLPPSDRLFSIYDMAFSESFFGVH